MNVMTTRRRQCGAARAKMRFRIREELERRGLTMTSLAAQIGVCNQAVSKTISGMTHSPRVLQALREIGVPEKYLCDPAKFEEVTEGKVA
ncbi:helix-turn-helix domain-containing protein [Nitratidesulfovibrio vulgaris]|jgi:transcriptional regulator with XRE-family HTH domain|uniref:Transcriptional regulator, putative n=1 Tax=Nitratidesulfovibrio vulgaris (strain ATCC 29579 / DSM 644 / CCUG 34227 / NCIMB 8303 / VKM B-1760 / Hildenborough) TaxID=882 RepID=Q72CY9_NITV2|nr:helix-turn-helix transcriptional regulator [Nitratidesulfovibrio vulgaris]AAS95622.1 transcriptional regulator, putative [Nitratidesulfovibrio vulgaris str. Hildenborough]ADP86225.1 hypothetical protein Deval_1061 [Nitratidesulfovibrio vulgaris RCH1]